LMMRGGITVRRGINTTPFTILPVMILVFSLDLVPGIFSLYSTYIELVHNSEYSLLNSRASKHTYAAL
jgi:hypothetical protein